MTKAKTTNTIEVKAIVEEFKTILTYTITLFVKLNSTNITFTCSSKIAAKVLSASNNPIIM
jgi:hypothetical protein